MQAKTKRLAPARRRGTIVEVLAPDQPRFRVRWGDCSETVIVPLGDSVRIEPAGTEPV